MVGGMGRLILVLTGLALGCASGPSSPLMEPKRLTAQAPAVFRARFVTTKGPFEIEVHRAWAPLGADRFYNLVGAGFYDGVKFFRAVKGFMVQFGINGQPAISKRWVEATIPDDPVEQANLRGFVTFATSGRDSRTTQIFINLVDNKRLDASGFSPFGQVVSGMEVVDSLHTGYGEGPPGGPGPDQEWIEAEGNAYLERSFPALDAVKTATIVR
jgi:peptidyl-prolyl cis-trans isomerase A (cyclophilin A)